MSNPTLTVQNLKERLDFPAYTPAEAGRLSGLNPKRVHRWLHGYEYKYRGERVRGEPVVRQETAAETGYASFLDLIDLLFVKRFLDTGVKLRTLRRALDEASEILGTNHFARKTFFSDTENVYLRVKEAGEEEGEAILQLLSGGQWVIPEVIRQLGHQIEFHEESELARRWYPFLPEGLIVVDPFVSFGRPVVIESGISTESIYEYYKAENRDVDRVCTWLELMPEQVEAAVRFEERTAA